MNVEVYTDVTKILEMASAAASALHVVCEGLPSGESSSPLTPTPQGPTMWISGEFACACQVCSTHPCPLQVHKAMWVGKGGHWSPLILPLSTKRRPRGPAEELWVASLLLVSIPVQSPTHRSTWGALPAGTARGGSSPSPCRGPGTCGS